MPTTHTEQLGPPSLAQRIDDALPQTQCTRCGYPDCTAYARAIAADMANINRCPPGGTVGIERLAAITGRTPGPLDPACGVEGPRRMAFVLEASCIGCTLCIAACPTDAIIGAPKWLHTVIESRCTGCGLCIPACPVDCIALESASGTRTGWAAWSQPQADAARVHYERRRQRIGQKEEPADAQAAPAVPPPGHHAAPTPASDRKRAAVQAALALARERRPTSP